MDKTEIPKVFISYSWKPDKNREWVEELANRLSTDGVHVVLDIWDLKEGQDKFHFMEQMVHDPDIKKVLLICNKEYAEKADNRTGGVGDESTIISSKVYGSVKQEKFVPLIVERDENGHEFVPHFLKSKLYFDFSQEDNFEVDYEKLLRNIFGKPSSKRPTIGVPPSYIKDEEPIFLRTTHKIGPIKNALQKGATNAQVFIDDYFDTFIEELDDHVIEDRIEVQSDDMDSMYIDEIERLKPLRDDFILFIETVFKYSTNIDLDKFHDFFERLLACNINYNSKVQSNILTKLTGNHITFLIYELFLYVVADALIRERFFIISHLVYNPYFVTKDKIEAYRFLEFNSGVFLFEYRKKRLRSNRVSLFGDTIKERATNESIKFIDIQEADLLLYYISCLESAPHPQIKWFDFWMPHTSAYGVKMFPRLDKLISERFFEKFKIVLNIDNKEELIEKIEKFGDGRNTGIHGFEYRAPMIKYALKFDELCKYK